MKTRVLYVTADNVEHRTKQAAENHALERATLALKSVLQDAGIENAHGHATQIIAKATADDDDLGEFYYKLLEAVTYIKDSYQVKREDD